MCDTGFEISTTLVLNLAFFFFSEKQRQEEMVGNERMKIEEHINKLSQDIEKEEEDNKKKKELFVEDLDKQVEEKQQIHTRKTRSQLFKQTNELSDRLTKLYMNKDESELAVSFIPLFKILKK